MPPHSWGMSQRPRLTLNQPRVLGRAEAIRPNYRSAAEIAPELGMDIHTTMFALQELLRRGYVRFGPQSMSETAETVIYQAATKGLPPFR